MSPRVWFWQLLVSAACAIPSLHGAETGKDPREWWSFKPAVRPSIPHATNGWARNEVDEFVAAKLRAEGLQPSPEADRRTLIRRVTFNLIGLPPTPEEVREFIADTSTNAFEKVVDRLLASPRYGERWARHWLDTVHYGETHGYDKDKPRLNAWPYRDYVIESLNSDKPYSRFVEEQVAADVLFPDAPSVIPALGFIAAGPWDFVGHVELPISKMDGLIARYNDRDDMVMNAMSTFQSLTVHCARCHDHKFDPISQRDYYGLQAVFAGVDRADRAFDADPKVAKKRRELTKHIAALKEDRAKLDAEIARAGGEELQRLDKRITEANRAERPNKAAFGYHSQISLTPDAEKWVQVDLGGSRQIDRITFVGCHDDFNNIGAGFGFPPRFKIEASDDAQFRSATMLHDGTVADLPNPGVKPQDIRVGKPARYVRMTATKLAPRKDDFIFAVAELIVVSDDKNIAHNAKVTALDSIEASPRWRRQNLVDGYYFGVETNAPQQVIAELKVEKEKLLQRIVPQELTKRIEANESALKAAQSDLAALPKPQMVYAATADFPANGAFIPAKTPRAVHLLKRGDVKRPGDEMSAAALSAVPGMEAQLQVGDPKNEGLRRAALATWITSTNNMLTRRSIVNRVWHYHLGRGIVDTPNDFGHMGATPSHPELLDWLAFWFLENGESLKKLHRLIVTSATYRQASDVQAMPDAATSRAKHATADSQNRFLWRMNRARLDAEQFHDALLAISGKLDRTMKGPSVQQFGFKDDHSPVYDYARFDLDTPGANRRSIYRFIVRSVPDPFMDALDCPDANILTPVRNTTMTALQALAALNDPFVIRQCEHFALRLEREGKSLGDQIDRAYQLTMGREPTASERAKLTAHARKHGLASACRILFNSNEFMFVD
jgi:hypothetical protein